MTATAGNGLGGSGGVDGSGWPAPKTAATTSPWSAIEPTSAAAHPFGRPAIMPVAIPRSIAARA